MTQFDNEIAALEEMRGLMNERAKLLVDVDYAERKVRVIGWDTPLQPGATTSHVTRLLVQLALDQQRGNINRIADRKRNVRAISSCWW